jgi:putative PIN family toxin of toxin-antitoxin system
VTNELRVIVDTNVAISAMLDSESTPGRAVDVAAKQGTLLISKETILELETVLIRPKFDRFVSLERRMEFLGTLVEQAVAVEINDFVRECRDPKDDKFLELAVSGNASHIVSGDVDLLVLHPFRGIDIVTPQAFLAGLPENG